MSNWPFCLHGNSIELYSLFFLFVFFLSMTSNRLTTYLELGPVIGLMIGKRRDSAYIREYVSS
jgi:hypothetical protein